MSHHFGCVRAPSWVWRNSARKLVARSRACLITPHAFHATVGWRHLVKHRIPNGKSHVKRAESKPQQLPRVHNRTRSSSVWTHQPGRQWCGVRYSRITKSRTRVPITITITITINSMVQYQYSMYIFFITTIIGTRARNKKQVHRCIS